MDKISLKARTRQFTTMLSFSENDEGRTLLLWRLLLGVFIITLGVTWYVAYQVYLWSIASVEVTVIPVEKGDTLTSEEINQVLRMYDDKRTRYKELLTQPPTAPDIISMTIEEEVGSVKIDSIQ